MKERELLIKFGNWLTDAPLYDNLHQTVDRFLSLHPQEDKGCKCKEKVKCGNCDEMVNMVSSGEFCPNCYC